MNLDDYPNAATALPALLAACEFAAVTFRYYEDLHKAKGLAGSDKALANANNAKIMEAALAQAKEGVK